MRRAGELLIFLLLAASVQAGGGKCTFRVHLEANAQDGIFAQPLHSRTGSAVYIERTAWLSENDVRSYYPYRAADGSYAALLNLDDHGRTVLDTLSVEHRGAVLYLFVNGRPLSELQIDRRVSDGRIYLASGLTTEDIKLMNKAWKLAGAGRKK